MSDQHTIIYDDKFRLFSAPIIPSLISILTTLIGFSCGIYIFLEIVLIDFHLIDLIISFLCFYCSIVTNVLLINSQNPLNLLAPGYHVELDCLGFSLSEIKEVKDWLGTTGTRHRFMNYNDGWRFYHQHSYKIVFWNREEMFQFVLRFIK